MGIFPSYSTIKEWLDNAVKYLIKVLVSGSVIVLSLPAQVLLTMLNDDIGWIDPMQRRKVVARHSSFRLSFDYLDAEVIRERFTLDYDILRPLVRREDMSLVYQDGLLTIMEAFSL